MIASRCRETYTKRSVSRDFSNRPVEEVYDKVLTNQDGEEEVDREEKHREREKVHRVVDAEDCAEGVSQNRSIACWCEDHLPRRTMRQRKLALNMTAASNLKMGKRIMSCDKVFLLDRVG